MVDNEDFKEIEALLKKGRVSKVPDEALSGFTEGVLTRARERRRARHTRLALCAFALAASALVSFFVYYGKPAARPQPAPEPLLVTSAPAAPPEAPAPKRTARQELTLEQEMKLLEEISDENGILDGVVDDEELIRHEMAITAPRRL